MAALDKPHAALLQLSLVETGEGSSTGWRDGLHSARLSLICCKVNAVYFLTHNVGTLHGRACVPLDGTMARTPVPSRLRHGYLGCDTRGTDLSRKRQGVVSHTFTRNNVPGLTPFTCHTNPCVVTRILHQLKRACKLNALLYSVHNHKAPHLYDPNKRLAFAMLLASLFSFIPLGPAGEMPGGQPALADCAPHLTIRWPPLARQSQTNLSCNSTKSAHMGVHPIESGGVMYA